MREKTAKDRIRETTGRRTLLRQEKEKEYKKPGICSDHIFISGTVYLSDGIFFLLPVFKSEEFINNPYNTRQETFAQKIVRGQILTNDGQVLAETVTDSEGNETRRYPYGSIFSHIVRYSTRKIRHRVTGKF